MKPTVFRERLLRHLTILVLILATVIYPGVSASAALVSIPGLFNTGVDEDGKKLGDRAPEVHYVLSGVAEDAFVISDGSRPNEWTPSRGQSAWIGPPRGNDDAPTGDYLYTLTFDLSRFYPETAVIIGSWAADNASKILLNDEPTGIEKGIFGYQELTEFAITSGFLAGKNTLQIDVNNGVGPTGLLVTDLTGSAAVIPVPGAVWLFASGLVALIGIRSRMQN